MAVMSDKAKKKTRAKDTDPAPTVEMIVRRGALRRYDKLKQATADLPVQLTWDRRLSERRSSAGSQEQERRRHDRRQAPPFTWTAADFVVIERPGAQEPSAKSKSKPRS
jgi:hypothetical protein